MFRNENSMHQKVTDPFSRSVNQVKGKNSTIEQPETLFGQGIAFTDHRGDNKMSSSSSNYVKVCKGTFTTGTMAMYLNTTTSPKEREIEGKILLKLTYPSFVKGVWIKLIGTNSVSSEKFGVLSTDLFAGDEDHHKDGLHQVLIGFGEGDNSHGTYLEMGAGRHSWPFHFKLPYYAPATYFDGNNSIAYKLVAIIDSPLVQSSNNRLLLQHEHIAMNYSHFSYVRLKEAQVTENRELLQKGNWLVAPKGSTAAGGILPSIMNILRTPVSLSISGSPNGIAGAPVGASAAHCALFPFQSKQHEYEVLCSLSNVRSKHPVILKSELYIEVSTRSATTHSFPAHYPHVIGQPNSTADELGSAVNLQMNRLYKSSRTHLVWAGTTEVAPTYAEQVSIKVPVTIDAEQRLLSLNHKPNSLPLLQSSHAGKITHYTVDAPLFRHRIMLKVSAMRGDAPGQALCAPVFGELYVLPPRPETEPPVLLPLVAPVPVSVRAGMPRLSGPSSMAAATAASVHTAGVAALPSLQTDAASLGDSQETMGPSPVPAVGAETASTRVRRNSRSNRVTIAPPAEDAQEVSVRRRSRPSLVENAAAVLDASEAPDAAVAQEGSTVAPGSADQGTESSAATAASTELITVTTSTSTAALAPSRPVSGSSSRSSRSVRNHGGIASFRAAQAVTAGANVSTVPSAATAVVSAGNNENSHPNVAVAKTPHAKPTKTCHVIRVEAELLSRGPAAVVIDRNERRNEPIRTPQRFAFMYQVGVANVIEGTPIITAPTPVPINTVDYRAARRLYAQNNNYDCSEPSTPAGALAGTAGAYAGATPGDVGGNGALVEGFQYYSLESATGTPQPPRRGEHSFGSSFEDSSSFAMDDAMIADSEAVVAMPLPADDEHDDRIDAMTHSSSQQRRLFRSTFDGVDWLARNASTSEAADTERALDTARFPGHDGNLEARLAAVSDEAVEEPAVVEQVPDPVVDPLSELASEVTAFVHSISSLPAMVC